MPTLNYTPTFTASQFMRSNSHIRLICGPIGSGKTVACCMEILRRAAEQKPGNDGIQRTRWVVVRPTYRELNDSTIKTWNEWIRPLGTWRETDKTFTIRMGTIEAEVLFRALDTVDDTKKLLSLELTGAFLSEVREIRAEIIEAVMGRIGRYPPAMAGGPTWHGLIMDTNMPVFGSYHYAMMEHVDYGPYNGSTSEWKVFRQPGGRTPNAENVNNLPDGYYDPKGRSEEYIRVMIDAEYGTSMDGLPVFGRSFRRDFHVVPAETLTPKSMSMVARLAGVEAMPLIIGFDPGMHCAAVLGSLTLDGRAVIFDELVADDMGAQRFTRTLLKPLMAARYPNMTHLVIVDPSGVARVNTDESSVVSIMRKEGLHVKPAGTNALQARIGAMERLLMRQIDGKAGLMISDRCVNLIRALSTDYRYKLKKDNELEDKPLKNSASHIVDSAMYLAMHIDDTIEGVPRAYRAKPVERANYVWI